MARQNLGAKATALAGFGPTRLLSVVDVVQPPQGRLTLIGYLPYMTGVGNQAVIASTTVGYTPATGSLVPVIAFAGASFVMAPFLDQSQALNDTTYSPAAAVANMCYDMFAWLDRSVSPPVLRVTRGPAWSAGQVTGSNTTRGNGNGSTALQNFAGVQVNAYDIQNGPKTYYGTYVGTILTDPVLNSSGLATCSFTMGGTAAGGTPALLNVFNYFNRLNYVAQVRDSTASWKPSTTIGPLNGSTGNRISYCCGFPLDNYNAFLSLKVNNGGNSGEALVGLGFNSTTAFAASSDFAISLTTPPTMGVSLATGYAPAAAYGANYIQALQQQVSGTAFSIYGGSSMTMNLEWIG